MIFARPKTGAKILRIGGKKSTASLQRFHRRGRNHFAAAACAITTSGSRGRAAKQGRGK